MALTDESSGIPATMLVGPTSVGTQSVPYPMYMGNGGNSGFGGDNGWWIVLVLILLFAAGGWNNNGNNGGGFGGGQPIIVNDGGSSNVQRGFDQSAVMSGIAGIQSGVQNLSTQLCGATGDVQMAIANGFAGVEQGANTRQIANMQTAFAAQTAMNQGFNAMQAQLANCCCENRLANCQTQNIIQNEGNQTRFADANNTRDLLANQTANTQAILDKLCQLELDGKNDRIAELERQLAKAEMDASQTAQNSLIQRGFTDEVDQLYSRLNSCPVPTTPVFGRTPIFTCGGANGGCGCGGNNF